MRAEDLCGVRCDRSAALDRIEKNLQSFRRTRDRGRTKCGHAVLRQAGRHVGNGVGPIEHVDTLDAMHVDVDESWHDGVTRQIDYGPPPASVRRRQYLLNDAIT